MSENDKVRHSSEAEYARICKDLDRASELREVDTSRMTLAEKIQHQRAIKAAVESARGPASHERS